MTERLRGFGPIAAAEARILILGSMPSAESLRRQQYYGHPRNAFWPIMGALFGAGPSLPYADRTARLAAAGVAVWDVIAACARATSADAEIRDERPNDFAGFFATHPRIDHLFFNGGKSEEVFCRRVLGELPPPYRDIARTRLPSTSPALASLDFAQKLAAWRIVLQVLGSS